MISLCQSAVFADEEYTRHPFYGSRKMVVWLSTQGHIVKRKQVQRLMGILGLAAMATGINTSKKHPQHKIYPYLLRGLVLSGPIRFGAPI
ncbi:MAG: IS3 family transposase [Methylococcales bacterium]|nr:IS3 family transposase [Methylococcales bacterium]